jgi:esterase
MSSYLERFNYQLYGPEDGRKWVFLHGLMGYGSNWRKIVSQLENDNRVLTFDQRGHGRSWKPLTGYASEDYADDLHLIAQELNWQKFILVGHSMGGRNALLFGHKYAEMVEKLVIVDIGAEPNLRAIDYYKKLLSAVPAPFATKLEAKEFFLNTFPRLNISHENLLTLGQYLYSNLEEKEDGRIDWRFSQAGIIASVTQGRAKDVWSELRSLSVETLIIRGEKSTELSRDEYRRMLAANPRIQGREVANAGHWIHADQPQEFVRILLDFVNP